MNKIAIIGAGPGGLVVSKYLKHAGFDPVVYEQGDNIGGQWNGTAVYSGVWQTMRTNTSRIMTSFSDFPHGEDIAVYPTNQQMLDYLCRYASHFHVDQHVRLNTRVELIERHPDKNEYIVHSSNAGGETVTETYSHVIVASGRYNKPMIPEVPGLDSFSGDLGVSHTFQYESPEKFLDKQILIAGCSISSLEIASELAMQGSTKVITTNRRQRYILLKILAGVPTDHVAFNRFNAMAEECMPMEAIAQGFRELILRTSGSPEQYGAPKPADNVFIAGVTQSQNYLPLVAEGRILPKPWIDRIEGKTVYFIDDSSVAVDGIMFGTGFDLNLPFLDERIKNVLDIDAHHIDLHAFTFHPDLPGLAFLGLFELAGPYFPVLELQARWIAYSLGNQIDLPGDDEMRAGIRNYRENRGKPQQYPMHSLAILFSRLAGVEPVLQDWPDITRALMFGPLAPSSFRLSGPGAMEGALTNYIKDLNAFVAEPETGLTEEQKGLLKALAESHSDALFCEFIKHELNS